MPGKSSIGFSGLKKLTFLVEISKISKKLENLKIRRERSFCSTSYPSGNQVDGSPLVAINPVPRAPRLFMTCTYLNMFLVDKTMLIWKGATWKVSFTHSNLILAEWNTRWQCN